jgi:hypothetical protein
MQKKREVRSAAISIAGQKASSIFTREENSCFFQYVALME